MLFYGKVGFFNDYRVGPIVKVGFNDVYNVILKYVRLKKCPVDVKEN